jgi:hypothetical protein
MDAGEIVMPEDSFAYGDVLHHVKWCNVSHYPVSISHIT